MGKTDVESAQGMTDGNDLRFKWVTGDVGAALPRRD